MTVTDLPAPTVLDAGRFSAETVLAVGGSRSTSLLDPHRIGRLLDLRPVGSGHPRRYTLRHAVTFALAVEMTPDGKPRARLERRDRVCAALMRTSVWRSFLIVSDTKVEWADTPTAAVHAAVEPGIHRADTATIVPVAARLDRALALLDA